MPNYLPNFAKNQPNRNLVFYILGEPSDGSEALQSPASQSGKRLDKRLGKVRQTNRQSYARLGKQLGKVRQR